MPKSEEPVIVGERVRERYLALNWTQPELAHNAGLSLPQVNRVILGRRDVSASSLYRLAGCLGTSGDYLLGLTDSPKPRRALDHPADGSPTAVIGERVRELYLARGMTQEELAWVSNVSLPQVSRIMHKRGEVSAATLYRLAVSLGTSSDYLLGLTDDPRPRTR